MTENVVLSITDHVAEVMLNRPGKFNALDLETFRDLGAVAAELCNNNAVRAVVLRGAGDNFCAGIDISVLAGQGGEIDASMMAPAPGSAANLFQRAAYAWRELPVPVICAIQGICYGGGLQVALGADLRFASPDARFSIMEAKWGLVPDMGITATLRGLVAADRVKELAWSARIFDATEALGLGVVTALDDDPLSLAQRTAGEYAARSPDAVRGIKRLVNEAWAMSEAEGLALEAQVQLGLLGGPNQVEAVRANLEKRAPEFSDSAGE